MDRLAAQARRLLLQRRLSLHAQFAPEGGPALRALTEEERRELGEIDAALDRIADGSYGRCEQCGQAMGFQRLRAVPEARACVDCSSRMKPPA